MSVQQRNAFWLHTNTLFVALTQLNNKSWPNMPKKDIKLKFKFTVQRKFIGVAMIKSGINSFRLQFFIANISVLFAIFLLKNSMIDFRSNSLTIFLYLYFYIDLIKSSFWTSPIKLKSSCTN